jgi:acetolactate synthase-1/2/3 large subunit
LPADVAWNDADGPADPLPAIAASTVADTTVDNVAEALRAAQSPVILARGEALHGSGLDSMSRIAQQVGARLMCDTFAPRVRAGAGVVALERIPYFGEQIAETFAQTDLLVLVGTTEPVSFFAYPGKPSECLPAACRVARLAQPHEDGVDALERLSHAVGADGLSPVTAPLKIPDFSDGKFNQVAVAAALANLLPEDAIIVDEAATNGGAPKAFTATAQPHDLLSLTGGSIGMGLPLATGASVAAPGRKVVCLHGDGGAMYTVQSLWTMARENLDIVIVIFANRSYKILNVELSRVGAAPAGEKALSTLNIGDPNLDWVSIATGMGVDAQRAETASQFNDLLRDAMKHSGPRLIEAVVA